MNKDDVSLLNKISIIVYHMSFIVGFALFVITLIPIQLMFGWFTPEEFWKNISIRIDEIIDEKIERLDYDIERLKRK